MIGEQKAAMRLGVTKVEVLIGILIGVAIVVALVSAVLFNPTGRKSSGLGVEELAKIDPALILYAESADAIRTGFSKARAISVDSAGVIYVAGDRAVKVFDSGGKFVRSVGLDGEARCVAVADLLYVGMGDHVQVYDVSGKRVASWESLGDSAVITAIAVSKDGDVFVADAGNRVVVRYDGSGNVIGEIGRKDEERNVPGFVIPSWYFDLVIPRDGMLRIVNPGRQRVETYTVEGEFQFSWGRASVEIDGFCGCCNPVNIAVLPDDSFVTCEKGLNRVKVYDHDGNFEGVVAGAEQLSPDAVLKICLLPEQCQSGGFDVAADAEGRVYVLDTIKNVVRIFSRKEM
jgi:hypothetical protein